jgi:hypothetical protein
MKFGMDFLPLEIFEKYANILCKNKMATAWSLFSFQFDSNS